MGISDLGHHAPLGAASSFGGGHACRREREREPNVCCGRKEGRAPKKKERQKGKRELERWGRVRCAERQTERKKERERERERESERARVVLLFCEDKEAAEAGEVCDLCLNQLPIKALGLDNSRPEMQRMPRRPSCVCMARCPWSREPRVEVQSGISKHSGPLKLPANEDGPGRNPPKGY